MRVSALAAVFLVAPMLLSAATAASAAGIVRIVPTIPLAIRAHGRLYRFRVEVARTEAEQARGLMFRKVVPSMGGMLFPFDPPRPASFWMKNTLVPLDMVFIRPDGSIARVAARTTPLSLDPVEEGEPTAAVLELRGGRAAELGITEQARVSWRGGPAG